MFECAIIPLLSLWGTHENHAKCRLICVLQIMSNQYVSTNHGKTSETVSGNDLERNCWW